MPPLNDCNVAESQFYDIEHGDDLPAAGPLDPEKEKLLNTTEERPFAHRGGFSSGLIFKLVLAVIVGSCVAMVWIFHSCLLDKRLQHEDLIYSNFRLVKDAVSASTSGVTEDFQVYQPVFTPSGATDETTSDNGSENTTTVAQTNATSSCQVLLMQHSFAFSYGIPFVGQYKPMCSHYFPHISP